LNLPNTKVTTESHYITLRGLRVEVVRKNIKNLHLGVYPPGGRVRVAAPLLLKDDSVRLAIVGKLGWIRRQRAKFENQSRQSEREMVSGETHYLFGQRYRLRVIEHDAPAQILIRNKSIIEVRVRPGTSSEYRERVLQAWYRSHLKVLIPALLEKWEKQLGVKVKGWGIRRMRTKWGTCNEKVGRIWLNLELAKKPEHCLEYVLVHEMTHLIERQHNDRFITIMDKAIPHWRSLKQELNAAPLAHEEWGY
jgi:predicted metal-dependent hydrolase